MKLEDFAGGVQRTAERYGMELLRPLALVSGGPDSVALLRALLELGGEPAVLHVDHGLRGDESREDAEFVRALCERLGVRCEVRRLQLAEGPNLQERARDERYGLAEIPPVRGRLVRPLIERTRLEVLDYLEGGIGQPYRMDPTNLTGKYARN